MRTKKKQILYIAPHLSSFIKEDIKLLECEYNTTLYINDWFNKFKIPLNFIKQFIYSLQNANKYDFIIVSFAGYWSLIPTYVFKFFNKKVFIILNGTDACSIPSLKYGNLRSIVHRFFIKMSLQKCDLILPVSESLIKTQITFSNVPNKEVNQGILSFFPEISTPFTVIPNAINDLFWKNLNCKRIKNSFITVFSERQFYLKGGDLIYDYAFQNPDKHFFIVGCDLKNSSTPSNVTFLGFISSEELLKYYNLSEYYLQLSTFEGFGCSLSEAILCGCIPIGSNANAIPEIIGNSKLILKRKNINYLTELINLLIKNPLTEIEKDNLIENIRNKYSLSKRLKLLKDQLVK